MSEGTELMQIARDNMVLVVALNDLCQPFADLRYRLVHPADQFCFRARIVAFSLRGPVSILVGPRRPGDLPVLVHVVSQRALVLRHAGPPDHSRSIATGRIAFPNGNKVKRPDLAFSKLNRPARAWVIKISSLHRISRLQTRESGHVHIRLE
jgi:hypothetical protein